MIDKGRFNFPAGTANTLRNEVTILRDLSHPGVVRLLNVFETRDQSYKTFYACSFYDPTSIRPNSV